MYVCVLCGCSPQSNIMKYYLNANKTLSIPFIFAPLKNDIKEFTICFLLSQRLSIHTLYALNVYKVN